MTADAAGSRVRRPSAQSSIAGILLHRREPSVWLDAKAQETARRALYGMAESECTVLSEIFKAECRLGNVSISIPIVVGNVASNTSAPSNSMSATAIYELKQAAWGR